MKNNLQKAHLGTWIGVVGRDKEKGEQSGLTEMLDIAHKAGYGGVDIFCASPHLALDASDAEIEQLVRDLSERGLGIGTLVAPIWGLNQVADPSKEGAFVDTVRKTAELGVKIEKAGGPRARNIRIDTGTESNVKLGGNYIRRFQRSAKVSRECAIVVSGSGFKLSIEPEPCWLFINTPQRVFNYMSIVDHPDAQVEADFSHLYHLGVGTSLPQADRLGMTLIQVLEQLQDFIGDVHVAQTDGSTRGGEGHPDTGQHTWLMDPNGKVNLVEAVEFVRGLDREIPFATYDGCLLPLDEFRDQAKHDENARVFKELIGSPVEVPA